MMFAFAALLAIDALAAPRSELPIREVMLSDGTRRYAVPISIGGRTVEAGLDSGSVGLRALPDVTNAAKVEGADRSYHYGVGTVLVGPKAEATVTFGNLSKAIPIQAVRSVGCEANRPHCPASRLSPTQFGIQGNGLPGEGFRAILGTGMASAELPNPLVAAGAHRWIIELPLPGQDWPGRLILNPSETELAGFTPLTLADDHRDRKNDAVRSCLRQIASSWSLCAPTLIDTGAPGIEVVNRTGPSWPDGAAGYFTFESNMEPKPSIRFVSGQRKQASRLTFVRDERVDGPRIRSGLISYFAYSILYDADRNIIAVKPRTPLPGGLLAGP